MVTAHHSYCLALTELSQEMADYSVRMQRVTSEVEKEQEGLGTALLKDADHTRCGGRGGGGKGGRGEEVLGQY